MRIAQYSISALLLIFFLVTSCEKPTNDCGCDAPIKYEIHDSLFLQGEMGYKIPVDPRDDYYNYKYWIAYTEQNCANCIHHFIVCNEDFLPSELEAELLSGKQLTVNFSGVAKEICRKTAGPADYTYNRIILTKIEKQ